MMPIPISKHEALLDLARLGDKTALDRLLVVCRPDLERYARRNCQSEDVEEAVQDALWILYRRVGGLRSVAAFTGWLFQIVRRACLSYLRRRQKHIPLEHMPAGNDWDRTATDNELRLIIADILTKLPPQYRDVILLRDIKGQSTEETAADLNLSLEATKSRLHRARALVRDAFSSPGNATTGNHAGGQRA
jgi:RNA polymerase sigma factor (sigma-70 family)